jgi:hypothetical protein
MRAVVFWLIIAALGAVLLFLIAPVALMIARLVIAFAEAPDFEPASVFSYLEGFIFVGIFAAIFLLPLIFVARLFWRTYCELTSRG